jgi:hypothetical protein
MDDHCGCVISYMYKYRMKLYNFTPNSCSHGPQITKGPAQKPCKVSNITPLNKICKMSRPHVQGYQSYGEFAPRAQTNIPCLGTPRQSIFYYKPQARAHSFHGLFWEFHTWWVYSGLVGKLIIALSSQTKLIIIVLSTLSLPKSFIYSLHFLWIYEHQQLSASYNLKAFAKM